MLCLSLQLPPVSLLSVVVSISSRLTLRTTSYTVPKIDTMAEQVIKKVIYPEFGGPSVVRVVESSIPAPVKTEIQCDVLYAGFSGADINMRIGYYPQQKSAPLTPGYCFVGRVTRKGPKATSMFQIGDLVGALTKYDSEAEKINVVEKYLIRVPENVDMREATALILDWNTAYGLVHRAGKVRKGHRVFIHGLSGAVGYAVMSLCLLQGATVYGTASSRNHEELRETGAIPFVYNNKDWMEEMRKLGGAHVIFDPLGFESWEESWNTLVRQEPSILVGYGGNMNILTDNVEAKPRSHLPAVMKLLAKNGCMVTKRSTSFYYIDRDRDTFMEDQLTVMQMLSEGRIDVCIKKIWDFDNIREPHETWGKVPGLGSCLIQVAKIV